jgi:hypothetical protein
VSGYLISTEMQTSSSASWQRKKGLGLDPGEGRLRSDSTRRAATTTAHALARQEFPRWLLQYNKKPCRNFTNKHTVVRFCRIRRLVIACNHRSVCSCRFVATREEGCLASGTHDGFPSLLFAWRLRRTRARSFTDGMQWASLDRGLAQRRLGFPSFFRMKSFHLEVSVHSSSSGHGMGTPTKVKKSNLASTLFVL